MEDTPSPDAGRSVSERAVAEAIVKEHRSIRTLLDRMASTRDLAALLAEIRNLEPLLRHHFQSEEAPDGLYAVLHDEVEGNYHRLEQLMAQHGELLVALRDLEEATRACVRGPIADVRRKTDDFVARIRAHESLEGQYLSEAFTTDTGALD